MAGLKKTLRIKDVQPISFSHLTSGRPSKVRKTFDSPDTDSNAILTISLCSPLSWSPVSVEALRCTSPQSKKTYRMSKEFIVSEGNSELEQANP
jgi:hypothetical protein